MSFYVGLFRASILCFCLLFQSCAVWTYGIRPDKTWEAKTQDKSEKVTEYFIKRNTVGFPMSNTYDLIDVFEKNYPSSQFKRLHEVPSTGRFIKVEEDYVVDGTGSLIWGYIAFCTLFILPAYTSGTGLFMRYHIVENGKTLKTYEYKIERKAFAWLPMIVFSWMNFFTDSETDAIGATVNKFAEEAKNDGYL